MDFPQFLLVLFLVLSSALLLGGAARMLGQSAVLGELLAGVLLGPSVLGRFGAADGPCLDPNNETFRLLAQLGVLVLLFEIGLETDLFKLLAVIRESAAVTLAGVALSFLFGYVVCRLLFDNPLLAMMVGASLTATSVGISARVLSEMGRLQDVESQIILGAAVLDDILGLILLAVMMGVIAGGPVRILKVAGIAALAFAFLTGALALGWLTLPLIQRLATWLELHGLMARSAFLLALLLALLAHAVQPGLAIIGAFAAGLLLARLPQTEALQSALAPLGHFLVPIFFLVTGSLVDVRMLNVQDPNNRRLLMVAALLLTAAVLGKFAAGYAPFWFRGRKSVIGAGMVPRGEVSLLFATAGAGVLGSSLFSALTLVVMATTLLTPPLLRLMLGPGHGAGRPALQGSVEE